MKYLIPITIFLLFHSPNLKASDLKIEPVYGVERTQREFPKPARYKTETYFGVRALYGTPSFSLEGEVNQSQDTEDFPDDNLKVTYKNQKALLGFRTYPIQSKILGVFLRFGARASKQTREITEAGESRTEEGAIIFDPYAGTGLTLVLGNNFALNTGATLIYNRNAEASEQYDTRYSFSFTIRAGNK
ncbi:MAG: hypothetical protein QF441_08450 [Bacteriovoracaceae bacterium]|jgi:hypothetical protein|nr:hypothetical protein [Halobacteriovoraceae bacterium]MDP7320625.1 hypothetical protein [Bacteriovoracaceae bacterium]|tara:strand:- start:1365 stop:1928 length:564 start_codon:yes stop_codon:yes gene_type:complete